MVRSWEVQGDLATVIMFDHGNGWAAIDKVATASQEDSDKFADALWDQVLNKSHAHQQHRDMLVKAAENCREEDSCECISRLTAAGILPQS